MTAHFKLRPYQQDILDKIVKSGEQRLCVSLATGGGKTILFSKLLDHLEGRTIILVHRQELVKQTAKTINRDHCLITPNKKYKGSDVTIAMVQTLNNRIKKGEIDINHFDNLIVDESHRGEFMKTLDLFEGKVIGFTATPNYEKSVTFYKCLVCGTENKTAKKCCGKQNEKYRRLIPLSKYYKNLIHGIDIDELIELDWLVLDENHIFQTDEKIEVWDSKTNELTEESANMIYGSKEGIQKSINAYNEICKGKKTIIFNPNTLVNKLLYDAMVIEGINVKMYDSNNAEENREDLINWFKTEKDAVLLNVQIFTTGFDVTDVECIFLNKKTRSINLYLQMVGRGGRITDFIFKPKFQVVDMGNNNELFGRWSDNRNWNNYFYLERVFKVGAPKPASTRTCHNCEALIAANSLDCEYCGVARVYNGVSSGSIISDTKKIIPSPEKIIDYCFKNNLDCNVARKITIKYTVSMFNNTKKETFIKHKDTSGFYFRARKFLLPYYMAISKSELDGNRRRKLETFVFNFINELEKYYD